MSDDLIRKLEAAGAIRLDPPSMGFGSPKPRPKPPEYA